MPAASILAVGIAAVLSAVALALATRQSRQRAYVLAGAIVAATAGQWLGPDHWWFTNAMVVLLGAGGGGLLGMTLRTRPSLISFAIAAAIVDVYSVLRGPTRALLTSAEGRPELMHWLVVGIPTDERVVGVVGAGDLLLAAALATALRGLGSSTAEALTAPAAALAVAMVAGLVLGPLPGLPFLAAATLVALWLRRSERASP